MDGSVALIDTLWPGSMTITGWAPEPVATGTCVGADERVGVGEGLARVVRTGAGRAEDDVAVLAGAALGDVAAAVVGTGADAALPDVLTCAEPEVQPAITDAARTATVADTIPERTCPP